MCTGGTADVLKGGRVWLREKYVCFFLYLSPSRIQRTLKDEGERGSDWPNGVRVSQICENGKCHGVDVPLVLYFFKKELRCVVHVRRKYDWRDICALGGHPLENQNE